MIDPSLLTWLLPNTNSGSLDGWRLTQTSCKYVNVHLSYASYFGTLARLFKSSGSGDEILMVGHSFLLKKTALTPGEFAFDLLKGAATRGVNIRIITNA